MYNSCNIHQKTQTEFLQTFQKLKISYRRASLAFGQVYSNFSGNFEQFKNARLLLYRIFHFLIKFCLDI